MHSAKGRENTQGPPAMAQVELITGHPGCGQPTAAAHTAQAPGKE